MINNLIQYTLKKPGHIIIAFAGLFLFSLGNIPFLKQVSDISQLINKEDKAIRLNAKMEGIFGSTRLGLISFQDAFTLQKLKEAARIHNELQSQAEVVDVVSIFSEEYLSGGGGSFEVEKIVPIVPQNQTEIKQLKQRLQEFDLYKYSLYENNNLNYLVQFGSNISDQKMSEVINKIIAKSNFSKSLQTSGWPEINNSIKHVMDRDLFILVPLIFVIISFIFFYLFKTWRDVLTPLIIITVAIVTAVGFMALFGISLNVVSNSIPILLVAIGTSDGIHFLSKYYYYAPSIPENKKLLQKTTKIIAPTILLTSLTTMGGFLANLFSPVQSISEFGLVTAVGVFVAGLASYLLIPAILVKLKPQSKKVIHFERKHDLFFTQLSTLIYKVLIKHKVSASILILFFVMASLYSIKGLQANYTLLGYFSPESKVVVDAQAVSKTFGGLIEFNITVDTKKSDGLIDSNVLSAFDKVSKKYKEKYPDDIVFMASLSDYIKNMSKAYNGDKAYYRIPSDSDEIAQYLEVYSWSGEAEEDLKYVTDSSYQVGRIYGRFKLQENENGKVVERNLRYYEKIVQEISKDLNALITKNIEVQFYGELPMWITTLYNIVEGQITSVAIAIFIVFIMAWPILRSFPLTLISLIPVTMAICFNFAFMNFFNIQLDIATSLVSAMAIGIGIDDALHFLLTYKRLVHENNGIKSLNSTLLETMQVTGKAILATSITLILGYSVFFFSSFKPINNFGLLNILVIILATFATLIAIPLAILVFKPLIRQKK